MALSAAARILARQGPEGLTTRAVATKIGYTVGSLYLVFRNLDDLILQLNARTLDDLYAAMQTALSHDAGTGAGILALADTYIQFAFEHRARWRLIFEQPLPARTPPWFQERVTRMFALVEQKLRLLATHRPAEEIRQAARALWGGVHGVCALGLTDRLDDTGPAPVQALARSLVRHYLAGFTSKPSTSLLRKRLR